MEKLWSTMKGAMGRISNVGDPLGLHTFLCTSSLGLDVASVLQTLCDPVVAHCDKNLRSCGRMVTVCAVMCVAGVSSCCEHVLG